MDVIGRIDNARATRNVLEHPFYERWSAGELSAPELAAYAGEYRHAVLALADVSALAAQAAAGSEQGAGLSRHAEEEAAHVELWDEFARASARAAAAEGAEGAAGGLGDRAGHAREPGAPHAHSPLPQTVACAQAWTAGEDLLEHLAVLYAIEASQPEISRTKLQGLIEHYGYTPDAPALEYFELHERLDVEHAHQASELIGRLLDSHPDPGGKAAQMVARARAALDGNWLLLDGVLAAATATPGAASTVTHGAAASPAPVAAALAAAGTVPAPAAA